MKNVSLQQINELQQLIDTDASCLVYFSGSSCNVCHALKPKVIDLVERRFPEMTFCEVNTEEAREAAGQFGVHSVPTVLVFFDSQESFRYTRGFSISQLAQDIERPYSMLFD